MDASSPLAAIRSLRRAHPEWFRPIPLCGDRGGRWDGVVLQAQDPALDPPVPIGPFAPAPYDALFPDPIYAAPFDDSPYAPDGLFGYPAAVFVRRSVADALLRVQEAVRGAGLLVVVYDSLRSTDAQSVLFDAFRAETVRLATEEGLALDDAQIDAHTWEYVAPPSRDPAWPSPHQVGAVDMVLAWLPPAVAAEVEQVLQTSRAARDERGPFLEAVGVLERERLTLIKDNAEVLPYGCAFDHGGPAAYLRHLEEQQARGELVPADEPALYARRLLFWLMTEVAALAPVSSEYWHYDPATSQMGVQVLRRGRAVLGAMELTDADREHAAHVQGWYAELGHEPEGRWTSLPTAECILPTREGVLAYAHRIGVRPGR